MEKTISKYFKNIRELIDFLKGEEIVFIQPHNFPDHDAVASSYGLQYLLKQFGITSHLVYEGRLQRDSLRKFIEELKIDIKHIDEYDMRVDHKIIIVDGCKGNHNVTDLIGDEVAVIDHHYVAVPEDVEFCDIRPEYGACVSIIASYFFELNIEIPRDIATVFLIGINVDTAQLTRGFSKDDQKVYFHCYPLANDIFANSVLRNYILIEDLKYYRYLIENLKYYKKLAFCYFPEGCEHNRLGILADFALALEETEFVTLCAKNGGIVNFSLRNETTFWDASKVIRKILSNIGFGGGHSEMAGGVITNKTDFNQIEIFDQFKQLLYDDQGLILEHLL